MRFPNGLILGLDTAISYRHFFSSQNPKKLFHYLYLKDKSKKSKDKKRSKSREDRKRSKSREDGKDRSKSRDKNEDKDNKDEAKMDGGEVDEKKEKMEVNKV